MKTYLPTCVSRLTNTPSLYNRLMSTARYVHWQEGETWLSYFEQFPDYLTQGESLSDLEEQLRELYRDLTSGEIPGIRSIAELAVE